MTVRFFPGSKKHKTSLVAGFLKQFRVDHEMVRPDQYKHIHHLGTDPALEVDGKLFVDPNVDALKKILHLEPAAD